MTTQTESIPGYVAGKWAIDAVHSDVSFYVRHLGVSKVRGHFANFEGTIVTAENPLDSTVSAVIKYRFRVHEQRVPGRARTQRGLPGHRAVPRDDLHLHRDPRREHRGGLPGGRRADPARCDQAGHPGARAERLRHATTRATRSPASRPRPRSAGASSVSPVAPPVPRSATRSVSPWRSRRPRPDAPPRGSAQLADRFRPSPAVVRRGGRRRFPGG